MGSPGLLEVRMPETGMQRFAAWLKQTMESRGLSARQIASYANVSPTTVSLWVKGVSEPRRDSLRKLADGLGVPFSTLSALLEAHLTNDEALEPYVASRDQLEDEIEEWLRRGMDLLRRRRQGRDN